MNMRADNSKTTSILDAKIFSAETQSGWFQKCQSRRVIHCIFQNGGSPILVKGKVTCTFYSNFELGIYEDNLSPFLEYPDIFSMLEWLGTNMSKMPARCQLLVSQLFFGFTVEYTNCQVR